MSEHYWLRRKVTWCVLGQIVIAFLRLRRCVQDRQLMPATTRGSEGEAEAYLSRNKSGMSEGPGVTRSTQPETCVRLQQLMQAALAPGDAAEAEKKHLDTDLSVSARASAAATQSLAAL
jgi:hypothetical protein